MFGSATTASSPPLRVRNCNPKKLARSLVNFNWVNRFSGCLISVPFCTNEPNQYVMDPKTYVPKEIKQNPSILNRGFRRIYTWAINAPTINATPRCGLRRKANVRPRAFCFDEPPNMNLTTNNASKRSRNANSDIKIISGPEKRTVCHGLILICNPVKNLCEVL